MKAVSRVGNLLVGVALAAAPAMARAQQAPPTSNTTTNDVVGPRELRNFSLPGTVTRTAEPPAPATTAADKPTPAPAAETPKPRADAPPVQRTTPSVSRNTEVTPRSSAPAAPRTQSPPTSSAPKSDGGAPGSVAATPAPVESFPSATPAPAPAPSAPVVPLYGWLIAALVLGGGAAFLFKRRRAEAFADGPQTEQFEEAPPAAAPEPAPPPTQASSPAPAPAPAPVGIVSTTLRPWVDIGFSPVRCVLDQERATIGFIVELFNSGSAPARNILVDATALNAGPTQDAIISAYFGQPAERGQRIEVIPPLDRVALELQISMPREQLQPYDLGGQQVFVPLVALNVLYRWNGGDAQTSAAYLIGRGTGTDKLGPLRIESGPRIFRGLAAKALPGSVRR